MVRGNSQHRRVTGSQRAAAAARAAQVGQLMLSTKDILVIDDDAPIVEMMAEVLRYEGYAVRSACDGPSALTAVAMQLPALILLDATMIGEGTTLFEQLRSQIDTPVPIVTLSAASGIGDSMRAQGAADFLAKPFDLDDLLACVARYVPHPQPHTH